MLTKGAIGNLVNRYRAVLKKCNLINTFGSLAVASMLVLGGAGVAGAENVADTKQPTSLTQEVNEVKLWYHSDYGGVSDNAYVDMAGHNMTFNNSENTAVYANKQIKISDSLNSGIFTAESQNSIAIKLTAVDHSIQAKEIHIKGNDNAVYVESGSLTLDADIIDISSSTQNGVQAQRGSFSIVDATKVSITASKDGGSAIRVSSLKNEAPGKIEISTKDLIIDASRAIKNDASVLATIEATGTAEITGDVIASKEGGINLSMTGTDSFLKGSILEEDIINKGGVTFGLTHGATWTPIIASTLSTFNADGGIVDTATNDASVTITKAVSGKINVVMDAVGTATFTVAENADSSEASVTATATANADYVTDEQAQEMVNRIAGADNKSAVVEEGKTRGAMTVGADGTVTTARNTLMDDALTMASVTTVSLDRILTNDVRKRLGDIRSDANTTGVWMRWDGGKLKGDSGLTNNFNTIQIGGDTKVAKNCRLGVAGSFTHGDTDFARGNGELEGFSFAAYATWMGENGMFADVVARLGHFSTEMNVEGDKGDMDNRVASISGEYGWRFNVCDQFFVEPQVELAYTYVSSEDLELGSAKYSFDNVDSLTGRAGLVVGWNLPDDRGNVYARASVVQQFMGDAKISGSVDGGLGNVQEIDGDDTWLEYGIGANVKLTDSTYIWADVERTEGAEIDEEWRGTVGVRFSF